MAGTRARIRLFSHSIMEQINKYDSYLSERTQKAKPLAKVKKKIVIWRGASGE